MEDARFGLPPYRVAAPARESAVVPLRRGGVHELAHVAHRRGEALGVDVEALAAVVELPLEGDVDGVGGHVAADLEDFVE